MNTLHASRTQIIFIDSQLPDLATLRAGLPADADVHWLDASRNGLQQIADVLDGQTDISALHLITHGAPGKLFMGNSAVDREILRNSHGEMEAISYAMAEDGELLIYGCEVAAGREGRLFVDALTEMTGLKVAAATHKVGAEGLGGNWVLDYAPYTTDTQELIRKTLAVPQWQWVLAATTVQFTTQKDPGFYGTDGITGITDIPNFQVDFEVNDAGSGSGSRVVAIDGQPGFTHNSGAIPWVRLLTDLNLTTQYGGTAATLEYFALSQFKVFNASGSPVILTVNGYLGGFETNPVMGFEEYVQGAVTVTQSNINIPTGQWTTVNLTGITGVSKVNIKSSSSAQLYFNDMVIEEVFPPFNDAPVITNLNSDSVAWADVGGYGVLDLDTNVTISDTETGALNSGTGDWSNGAGTDGALIVQRVTGGNADASANDVFAINDAGTPLFSIDGSNLQASGQTFATFTNTGGVLTITFTGSGTAATTALVRDVMTRILYRNDTPYGDATIRFALSDGTTATNADVTVISSVITVDRTDDDTGNDAADGFSLREALARSNAQAGADTVVLGGIASGTTITLAGTNATLGSGDTLSFAKAGPTTLTLAGSGGAALALGGAGFLSVDTDDQYC